MAEQVEAEKCWRGFLVEAERLYINRMNNNVVVMLPMTSRRRCTNILGQPAIIAELKHATWKARAALVSRPTGKLSDVCRDIHHSPVPETASSGGIWVIHGHDKTFRSCRKSTP